MYSDIEALILGTSPSRDSPEPPRAPSPNGGHAHDSDPGWHDEELLAAERQRHEDQGLDYDSDTARRDLIKNQLRHGGPDSQKDSIGMGPGRTGVKGVIRDRKEHAEIQREKRAKETEELRAKMEATAIGGKTFLEEEREKVARGEKVDDLVAKELERSAASAGREKRDVFGVRKDGRFGHLREVDSRNFVTAIEKEDQNVWVVVHLYDASLDRCYLVDEAMSRLARLNPDTKFLRAKAATLGFAKANTAPKPRPMKPTLRRLKEEDEDDPYKDDDYDDDDDDEATSDNDDDDVDLDMLPTVLVYRGGELVHNWVRVDWEAGPSGLEELLDKHHILSRRGGNLGFPVGDDDSSDLYFLWSDSDDEIGKQPKGF